MWWVDIQPKWQTNSSGTLARTTGGDTLTIQVGGQTGLLEFIMALAWWGAAIPRETPESSLMLQWREAVEDVVWILCN